MKSRDQQPTPYFTYYPLSHGKEGSIYHFLLYDPMTRFHDNQSPQMEEQICKMVELQRSHAGDSPDPTHSSEFLLAVCYPVKGTLN